MLITNMKAPFLTDKQIEWQAQSLLKSYQVSYEKISEPPVPIEDIMVRYLGLRLEIDDFTRNKYFGEIGAQILGYIDIRNKAIFINEQLDPLMNPAAHEGRFYFTLAHECGHFCLHQDLFEEFALQGGFFEDTKELRPAILCRHPDDEVAMRPFIQQQADKFAAALLMPQPLVSAAWIQQFGSDMPKTEQALVEQSTSLLYSLDYRQGLQEAIRPLAQRFKVSITAMRIRLQAMGLIVDGAQAMLV